ITDHIRSASFMICDGVLPSNEGRGYVLRRLLRRAARHGKLLGVNEPFLWQIVDTVAAVNEGEYKDVREKQAYITKVIRTEEENFAKTIDGGMKIFADMLQAHKAAGETTFSGADAFKLYDTYGFPIDLTLEMAKDEGLSVDEEAFRQLMQEQKERAREARRALGDLGWAGVDLGKEMPATEFVGYDCDECEAKVLAVVDGEDDSIVVLDKTPFYAEMGGQVADHGTIGGFTVTDVQKNKGGKYLHYGKMEQGALKAGDAVSARIDTARRQAIRRAHSATHLLDASLKRVLGEHVHQAGSLVEPDRIRFDFSHFEAVTPEQRREIEDLVNADILSGFAVTTEELPIEEAKKKGAVAMFGEKYGDVVRVVEMGENGSVSMEFCGGTHLNNTAEAGLFRIVSEASVASGVRRIEAVTGPAVLALLDRAEDTLRSAAAALRANPAELERRAEQLSDELKEAKRLVEQYKARESAGGALDLLKDAADVGGLRVVTATVASGDANSLRQMGDVLRDKDASVVAVLALAGEKATLLAVCGKDAVAKGVKAGDVIRSIAPIVGGKGGGKPDSAMGGGSDSAKIPDALAAVKPFVEHIVG
ncbi:MAG: alanine--tRNA ligase, partial [Oscillospiraceae bacterium]|nr:alanine--tRNA ligase [Oscillospiraceae bacterium]